LRQLVLLLLLLLLLMMMMMMVRCRGCAAAVVVAAAAAGCRGGRRSPLAAPQFERIVPQPARGVCVAFGEGLKRELREGREHEAVWLTHGNDPPPQVPG
jgi:hypothetical protein